MFCSFFNLIPIFFFLLYSLTLVISFMRRRQVDESDLPFVYIILGSLLFNCIFPRFDV
jgi:hypothetical protein